jgi:hypothetical protein
MWNSFSRVERAVIWAVAGIAALALVYIIALTGTDARRIVADALSDVVSFFTGLPGQVWELTR